MDFSNTLINWYLQNKRDLPWRNTTNPYPIWLSEIILQQTKVVQGLPYFLKFIANFPTVFDLAKADEQQVLVLWQGLGYYSRARNLHKTAQYIAFECNGIFPNNYNQLLKLKGIGEYTAAAIASFSFNEVVPVVDGNVFRVISRYFNIETDIALASAKKEFSSLALELMYNDTSNVRPALFNQAIMEFGALQCVPKNPNCEICIFNESCAALQLKKTDQLPVKAKKQKAKNRFLNYLFITDSIQNTIIHKRTNKGIWQNLFEFPLIESDKEENYNWVSLQIQSILCNNSIESISHHQTENVIHKLTHQTLHIQFWHVKLKDVLTEGIPKTNLKSFPFPIVLYNFIDSL